LIGDFLYQLSPRDEQSTGIQLFAERNQVSAAVVSQSLSITIPAEKILVVTAIWVDASGGGGQTVSSLQISRQSTNVPDVVVKSAQPATAFGGIGFEGTLYLAPNEQVQASASYNAGVAANNLRLFVHGYTIPRGVVNV